MLLATLPLLAADPFLGTWKLNTAQSKLTRPAPREMTVTWVAEGDSVKVVTRGANASGEPFQSEYVARYDGKETTRKGPWNWDVVINRQVSEHEREDVFKKGGKVEGHSRLVVSPDGKRLTVNFEYAGEHSMRVFDRQ